MQVETFLIPRQLHFFGVRVSSILEIDRGGLHYGVESRVFGVRVRRKIFTSMNWSEIAAIEKNTTPRGVGVRIVPVKVARFIRPLTTAGILRVRPYVDDDGAWLMPLGSAQETERFLDVYKRESPKSSEHSPATRR